MKKIIFLLTLFLLTSCFQSNKDEIQKAKEEMFSTWITTLTWSTSLTWVTNSGLILDQNTNSSDSQSNNERYYYEVQKVLSKWLVDISPISNIENITDKLEINWIVSDKNIDKIVVTFTNSSSSFPKDVHTLSQYKKWDSKFVYRAFTQYQVLDKGLNEYLVEAYIWSELVDSLKLVVNIPKSLPSDTWTSSISPENIVSTNLWNENDNLFLSLPTNEAIYWSAKTNWNESFTYSQVNNLTFARDNNSFNMSCENIADYLSTVYTWYYWNTCRPVSWENWIYVNVLSLSWEEYIYNRVYIDKKHWLVWNLLLEKWVWVTKDTLSDKNNELKNSTYEVLQKSDKLFEDLLKN